MYDEINYFKNNKLNLTSPVEGYLKGNIFNDLYDSYKGLKPAKINFNSLQDEMLFNIGQISFFSHDLNLYLDNYPNDLETLSLFKKYSKMANSLISEYETKYGPINVSGSSSNIPFNWVSTFPWEGKNV